MFDGEIEGLKAMRETKTVLAPYPIATGQVNNSHYVLVLEHFNLTRINNRGFAKLGRQMANMHLHNLKPKRSSVFITRYIFFKLNIFLFYSKNDGAIGIGRSYFF